MFTSIRRPLSILTLFILVASSSQAKVFVVSDIDDTIKKANSASSGIGEIYHFLRKKIYPEMRDLFVELERTYEARGEEVEFFYVSAAPDILFDQYKWLEKHSFPAGSATLRDIGSGDSYTYKKRVIGNILKEANPYDTIYLFGDNASKDAIVYKELVEEGNFVNSFIYIRDVETEATYWNPNFPIHRLSGIRYFFSERDLLTERGLFFMSAELRKLIVAAYDEKSLIPEYSLNTLEKRVKKVWDCGFDFVCRRDANAQAKNFWNAYYAKY